MFGVCIPHPETDFWLNQWEYLFTHFAPDKIWVWGLPENARYHADVEQVTSIAVLPDGIPLVLMAASESRYVRGEVPLDTFQHPEDAIYLFGGDSSNFSDDDFAGRTPDHNVFVRTASNHEMYSWIAGAITFYDRAVKRG